MDGFEPPVTEDSNRSTWLTNVPKMFGYKDHRIIRFVFIPRIIFNACLSQMSQLSRQLRRVSLKIYDDSKHNIHSTCGPKTLI